MATLLFCAQEDTTEGQDNICGDGFSIMLSPNCLPRLSGSDSLKSAFDQVQITHGRLDGAVTQEFLDRSNIQPYLHYS